MTNPKDTDLHCAEPPARVLTRRVWFDWVAHHAGEKDPARIGWGRTKQAAITDLLRLDVEMLERS